MICALPHQPAIKKMSHRYAQGKFDEGNSSFEVLVSQVTLVCEIDKKSASVEGESPSKQGPTQWPNGHGWCQGFASSRLCLKVSVFFHPAHWSTWVCQEDPGAGSPKNKLLSQNPEPAKSPFPNLASECRNLVFLPYSFSAIVSEVFFFVGLFLSLLSLKFSSNISLFMQVHLWEKEKSLVCSASVTHPSGEQRLSHQGPLLLS